MVKFVRFTPSSPANLKDNIAFAITELGPFEPNSTVPQFPQGSTSFLALTDLAASTAAAKDAILYINVSSDASTDKILLDNLSLTPATHQQVLDEIQRVAPLRQNVRATTSSFIEIKFGGKTILTQADKQNANALLPTASTVVKGEILDQADAFSTLAGLSATAFTNFVIASTTNFANVVGIIDNTTIKVSNVGFFQQNGFVSIINPASQLDGAIRQGFLTDPDSFSPRDIIFLKVTNINSGNSTLTVAPTTFSPILPSGSLFSIPEQQAVTDKDLIIAVPGIPILFDQKAAGIGYSLKEAQALVESEIPPTRLYAPKTAQPDGQAQFIGNLDRTSVSIIMYDDDQEAILVKQGEAQPGVGVDYKLITDKASPNYGDVQVSVKLNATPARIPIVGIASAGATAVSVGVRIASTPQRLDSSSTVVSTPGEFYFNFQIKDSKGNLVNLNKYGTVRIFDTISFFTAPSSQGGTLLATAMVHGIDDANSLIILDRPLQVNLPNTTIIEIPQTPLNPGRKYRITISCVDRQ